MKRPEAAAECYRRALEIDRGFADAHSNLGAALADLGRRDEAIACYQEALQLDPAHADAHNNLGLALRQMLRHEDAAACFRRAVEIKPGFADGHHNLGVTLAELRRPDEAIACFSAALQIEPEHALARAQRLHQQALICDWDAIAADRALIPALGVSGGAAPPFALLALEDDPGRHRLRAERFAREKLPAPSARPPPPAARPERLRIGYFSGDFHAHAVMYLVVRLFELHDRGRFEVQAFSYGPDKDDAMRARIKAGVDKFHEVRAMRDEDVAALARAEGLDIAVDLSGYTLRSRTGLFAHRAAPVQINYLGYPGAIGAPFIDYIVADRTIIPDEMRQFYSEQVIYLPHTYQPNDNTRPIAERAGSRRDVGLPEQGFVFCCFNNSYKISAAEFDIWMRLLREVEGSVLWLLKTNSLAMQNLQRAATQRDVSPARLIFAESLPLAEHLVRHRLADLFVDTFAYNAHTTASDALWAGLPLVTRLGRGFAARVAASLLNAVGLPELVTQSAEDYAALALRLARDPAALAEVRAKLDANRAIAPLFDSERYARHIENAYEQAYRRCLDGKAPAMIVVPN
jgi:predicted O-linked N-acetylglucosamine transferase (SPINDLY family)